MKVFIASVLIFFALIGFGVFSYRYLDHTSKEMVAKTENMQKFAEKGAWDKTDQAFKGFTVEWQQKTKIWTALIDHQELDNINLSIARVKKYIEVKDLTEFLAETAQLKTLITHIPQKEEFNIENIL